MRDRAPEKKPVFDAVNDAVSALSDLVRSLRQTAKHARSEAKVHARGLKVKARGVVVKAKKGARQAKATLTDRLGKAWDVLAHGEGRTSAPPASPRTPTTKRRVAVKA